jgi:hypothetical protein
MTENNNSENLNQFDSNDFMDFFWDDEKINTVSENDKIDIFLNILNGSEDITVELLQKLLNNYSIDNIEIIKK